MDSVSNAVSVRTGASHTFGHFITLHIDIYSIWQERCNSQSVATHLSEFLCHVVVRTAAPRRINVCWRCVLACMLTCLCGTFILYGSVLYDMQLTDADSSRARAHSIMITTMSSGALKAQVVLPDRKPVRFNVAATFRM